MCVFCKREISTREHHIIPKSKGGRITVPTCEACESFIHRTFTHAELRDRYSTVESVQGDERYQRFLKWLLKQQATAVFRSVRKRQESRSRDKLR